MTNIPGIDKFSFTKSTFMKAFIGILTVLTLFWACTPAETQQESELEEVAETPAHIGVWEYEKAVYSDDDTTYTWDNVSGVFIITEDYYSLMFVNNINNLMIWTSRIQYLSL